MSEIGNSMRFNRFLRISLLALAAATLTAAPAPMVEIPSAWAQAKPSAQAVEAARLALKGDFVEAGRAAERSGDVAAIKLVELIYLRDRPNDAGYQRIMAFLDIAPNWPLTEALLKRAERSLYVNEEPAELTLSHFSKRKPTTAQGSLALVRALQATGEGERARAELRKVWTDPEITAELEKAIVSEFGKMLTADDHQRLCAGNQCGDPHRQAPSLRLPESRRGGAEADPWRGGR